MFVVPQRTPYTTQSTHTAAPQRQRGTSAAASLFSPSSVTKSTRADDTSATRGSSQKTATVDNPAPHPAAGQIEASGMQKLLDTMSALGMSTSGMSISYSEEVVGYPGGSYTNKLINVTSGGKTEHFSAELTSKNPFVTAYEMQRYFGAASQVSYNR
ncbi:MAG: hypothetical protein HYX27_20540 [Acidobacteria bacterium]|nr:hypothetical protein [Acidobacteriota bacterium]